MQLKLKIVHVVGCYSLIDVDGVAYQKESVIQTAFYPPSDEAEKAAKLEQLISFGKGLTEGWLLARNALGSPIFHTTVEEFKPENDPSPFAMLKNSKAAQKAWEEGKDK